MMRIALSRRRLLAAIALLTVTLALGPSSPRATYAATASITPTQPITYLVAGIYHDSGVTLAENVPANPTYVNIKISDQSLLRTGWKVKIDNEVMLINDLIDGGPGYPPPPDTMVVYRAQAGTSVDPHSQNTMLQGPSIIVDIWAKGVTDATGLGGFEVHLTFPPAAQMLGFVSQDAWLTNTGREPWCDGPVQQDGIWKVMCWTTYDPSPGPAGPTGDGVIARVIVLPPPSGQATVSLLGSILSNRDGDKIPATTTNMTFKNISCPDTNGDGIVNVGDVFDTARQMGDGGKDCGVQLSSNASASDTTLQINDQSLAWWGGSQFSPACAGPSGTRPNTIAIDGESMTVVQFNAPANTVTVIRHINYSQARPHLAGASVYLTPSQWDGNYDGKNGYTRARDVAPDSFITGLDVLTVASNAYFSIDPLQCPSGG
jgi:hypothetical protein